jgi:hypothetical protein
MRCECLLHPVRDDGWSNGLRFHPGLQMQLPPISVCGLYACLLESSVNTPLRPPKLAVAEMRRRHAVREVTGDAVRVQIEPTDDRGTRMVRAGMDPAKCGQRCLQVRWHHLLQVQPRVRSPRPCAQRPTLGGVTSPSPFSCTSQTHAVLVRCAWQAQGSVFYCAGAERRALLPP